MNKKEFEIEPYEVWNQKLRKERFRQGKLSFNYAIGFGVVGTLILILSGLLISMGDKPLGYLGFVMGGIFNCAAVFFYKLYKNANDRLDILMNLPVPPATKGRNLIPFRKIIEKPSDSISNSQTFIQ